MKLYQAYVDGDADLVEINPLILTPDGKVHALDAKVSLDDNARFRHPEWDEFVGLEKLDAREREAAEKGLQYVGLDGDVGVIANGAGLAMATCDIVHEVGGRPANFLDIGGGASAQVMANALEVINNDPSVQSIFINIFGGITKGEEVANGIVQALEQVDDRVADRDPARRHERRRGPGDPAGARVGSAREQADDGGGRAYGRGDGGGAVVSILVNADTKVIVQGITGGQGRFYGLRNRAYGTKVVGGVSPKKAGTDVEGIPVFASVADAVPRRARPRRW